MPFLRFLPAIITAIIAVVLSPLLAQSQSFKLTFEHYLGSQATDTLSVSYFYRSSADAIDSVILIRYDSGRPFWVKKFYEWRPVSSYFTASSVCDARLELGFGFAQCSTGNQIPTIVRTWGLKQPSTLTIAEDTIFISDSLVVGWNHKNAFGDTIYNTWRRNYTYDNHGSMVQAELDEWDYYYSERHEVTTAAYKYDEETRIIEAVLARPNSTVRDSQLYTYSGSQLRSSQNWAMRKGKMIPLSKTEYYDWDTSRLVRSQLYVSEENYDTPPPISFGCAPFSIASVYAWDPYEARYKPWYRVTNDFDATGMLARHSTIDTSGSVSYMEFTYYPNGDLAKTREVTTLNDMLLGNNMNIYNAQGLLISSEQEWAGSKAFRYTASYLSSSVSTEVGDAPPEVILSQDRVSNIFDALGRRVLHFTGTTPDITSLHLPSGLYFISIDGGKPRKHLVP